MMIWLYRYRSLNQLQHYDEGDYGDEDNDYDDYDDAGYGDDKYDDVGYDDDNRQHIPYLQRFIVKRILIILKVMMTLIIMWW